MSETKKSYTKTIEEISQELEVDPSQGLSEEDYQNRLEKYGENKLQEKREVSFLKVLLHEIFEPMILLLFGVGIVYTIFGLVLEGDPFDGITIFVIIAILVFVEIYNEYRAKKTIESLKELAVPDATVLRDGKIQDIKPENLVLGDIVFLKVGNRVPADLRLTEAYGLQLDESALTGESTPVTKNAEHTLEGKTDLLERENMAFAGTTVTRGKGKGIVVATAMTTELGKIAGLTESIKEPKTPLQLAMKQLSLWLVGVAVFFAVLIPVVGILQGKNIFEMILTGLSLSFATVPEELPIIITVVLALGAYSLSKNNALVKYLKTAETLGSVTVIATDKTGTLTKNEMRLAKIYADGDTIELDGKELSECQRQVLEIGAMVNDVLIEKDGDLLSYKGDPMEIALIHAAEEANISYKELSQKYKLTQEFNFDNKRMMMSQIYKVNGSYNLFLKGATEQILNNAQQYISDGSKKDLTEDIKEEILAKVRDMAENGLRVLGFAFKELNTPDISQEEAEKDLIFCGIGGFIDPPRGEVKDAIEECKSAGIRVLMITGDYEQTAQAIGQEVGIDARKVLLGREVEEMDKDGLKGRVNYINVFARATPEHKLKIVEALKENGEQVAVTGDGINDAPALKKADIGVAMGKTGTDVAKETGDMVLLDDNFATITYAVEQGRKLYDNLRKGVRYYLAVKMALIVIFLLPVLFGVQLPFAPIQIILLELFMDLAASATFVVEPSETDVMKLPPRDPEAKFMDKEMNLGILMGAVSLIGAVLIVYFIALVIHPDEVARTIAFATWMVSHVLLAFNMRTIRDPLKKVGYLSNKMMIIWAIGAIGVMFLIVYIPPLQAVLNVTAIGFLDWVLIFGISIAFSFWIEIAKIVSEKYFSKK
jgi:Ca2+-transporting ATPase